MGTFQGIIFDLDGVICHTDKYHYQAWKQLADAMDIYFDEAINNRLRGVSRMESLEIILENSQMTLTQDKKIELAEAKNKAYRLLLEQMSPLDLSGEVKTTLETLKQKGFKLAIGSSSKNAEFILNRIGLKDFFPVISDGNAIRFSKPDPEVFLKAAEGLDLLPSQCLVVEDALAGIEAAKRGGFKSIGIGDAARGEDATYRIDNFAQILEIVDYGS